jgi:hypothetical protein
VEAFHFNRYPILEEILFLSNKLRREIPYTLLCVLAIRGAAEIQMRIQESVPTLFAGPYCIILEKLDFIPALGTFRLKDCAWFPIATILSWTFHD